MSKEKKSASSNNSLSTDKNITRKGALSKIKKGLAVSAIPFFAISTITDKAKAQYRDYEAVQMLNTLTQMEYMLHRFYLLAKRNKNLVPFPYTNSIHDIYAHHESHIVRTKTIASMIRSKKEVAARLSFNFNTENLSPGSNFDDFLQVAQVLEDASTSLYKRYLPKLREIDLQFVLRRDLTLIHTAEARHAAFIRMLRAEKGLADISPWISSSNDNDVQTSFEDIYINEDNTDQYKISVPTVSSVPPSTIREAWDEPCNGRPINKLFAFFKARN